MTVKGTEKIWLKVAVYLHNNYLIRLTYQRDGVENMYNVFDITDVPFEVKLFTSDDFRECLIFMLGYIKGIDRLFKLVVKDENGKIIWKGR